MKKKNLKTSRYLKLFLSIVIIFFSSNVYAEKINIRLNEQLLEFDSSPIIIEGTTFVPMRRIFEELGASVDWNQKENKAIAKKDGLALEIDLKKNKAYLNSKNIPIKKASILKDNRTLVPLRIISESLGAEILYKKNKESSDIDIYTECSKLGSLMIKDKSIQADTTIDDLIKVLNKPNRIDYYSDNISIYVYNSNNYKNYIQVFVNNKTKKILKLETNAPNWSINNKIRVGDKYDKNFIKEYSNLLKKQNLTLEVKPSFDNKINFIAVESRSMPKELWYENSNKNIEKILQTKEKQIFDYTNVFRVRNNLEPLERDERLDKLGKLHSIDMSKNNFMSHTNKKGLSAKDRFAAEKLNIYFGGENLSAGFLSSTESINALFNSRGHRTNILNNSNYLGVGIAYNKNSKYRIYYTQVFGR